MAEATEASGIGGLAGMLEKMNAYTDMLARDQAQAAQQEAEQSAQNEKQSIEFGAFVETAYVVAAADGNPSEAEIASLSRGVSELTQGRYSQEDIHKMVQAAAERLETEGKDARIGAIASVITDPGLRRAAFLVAAGLAWLDRGVGEKEGLRLQALSKAFEIPMNEMHQLLGQAKGR
jgi:phosphoenolpyruvate synthase/pyruvate phosphate dikinase